MLEEITVNTARTQSIEHAVSELSKRESVTMTDVREFMDVLVSKKILTGKKAKYTDPNGEEHEYEVKAPISDFYSYKADEKEIYSRSLETVLKNKKFFHELKDDVKVSDVLKWAALNANFIDKDDILVFTKWLLNTIVQIKETCKTGSVNKSIQNKTQLEFNSTTKGSGKSHFIEEFIKKTQEMGIEAKYEVPLPEGGFYNSLEESTNLLVGYKERVYQKVDEATMMSIGRHEDYVYVEKGKMAISVPANAITIGSTNGNPYAKDDRCFQIIRCIPTDYATRQQILQTSTNFLQTLQNDVTLYNTRIYNVETAKVCNFVSLLNSEENKSKDNNNATLNKLQNYKIPGMAVLQDVVADLITNLDLLSFTSVKGLYKIWEKNTGKHLEGMNKYMSFEKPISEALNFLYSRKLIKGRGPSEDMKRQYDIYSILDDIRTYDASDEERTIDDDVLEAAAEWEKIIKMAEDFENDPNNKFLKGSNEKLDDSWTICSKYDKEGKYNASGDQVCVNKPLEGETKNRTNTRVHQQNFLFECDDIPVKQQVEQIENASQELKDSLLWTCFTGGKSIHAIVHTNLKDEDMWTETNEYDTDLRKYIHQKLNEKYFGGKADPSGQNAGRLARAPNAIRQDEKHPGEKQLCLQFNMNAKALDVSGLVEDYKEEKKLSRTIKELTAKPPIPEEMRKEPSIHTLEDLKAWNTKAPSKAKQECIEFLEGTLQDWNRGLACVRELRNFGFTDCEIEFEGPANDRWIKAALKAAH